MSEISLKGNNEDINDDDRILIQKPLNMDNNTKSYDISNSCMEYLLLGLIQNYYKLSNEYNWDNNTLLGKLKNIGINIGKKVVERTTIDNKFQKELDIIKYLCKDFWFYCFRKTQCDKLQTNHKGTYVIHDNSFTWIKSISGNINDNDINNDNNNNNDSKQDNDVNINNESDNKMREIGLLYLNGAAGMIEGALINLNKNAEVNVELKKKSWPECMIFIC